MNGPMLMRSKDSLLSSSSLTTLAFVGFSIVYFAAVSAELLLAAPVGTLPIALSQGIAVGFVARTRSGSRSAALLIVFASGVLLELLAGMPVVIAIGDAVIVCTLVALAGWMLRLLGERGLPQWEGLLALVGIAAAVAAIEALTHLVLVGLAGAGTSTGAGLHSWVAVFAGIVIAAPAILMFRKARVPVTTGRVVELVAAVAITAGTVFGLIAMTFASPEQESEMRFLLIPLLLWFAIRFGLAITATVCSLVTISLVGAVQGGLALYASYALAADSLMYLELTLTIVVLAVFAVAVNEEQRRTRGLELMAADGLVKSLLSNSDAMISIVSYESSGTARYVLANPRFAKMLDCDVDQIVGRRQDDLAPDPATAARLHAEDLAVICADSSQVFVSRTNADDTHGSRVHLVTKFPVAGTKDGAAAVGSIAIDITDHRRRERLMRLTFDESPVPMVRLAWKNGRAGEILDANRSVAELLEVASTSLIGRQLDHFTHESDRNVELVSPGGMLGHPRRKEVRLVRAGGADVWVTLTATVVEADSAADDLIGEDDQFALVVLEDISARKVAEQTLTHQALHDALTGVLNRYALIDRLEAALSRLWRGDSYIAVLFCDLDGFKNLNDTLGHSAGDQMLISVSERLRNVMRPQDTVARLGGDEFVLVCEDLPSPSQARVIGERIRETMREPFELDGRAYGVTVSVGIATTTDASTRAEDLLRQADLAMYRAKDAGRNRVEYYAEELEARAVAHVEATETLRRALEARDVVVHYQPIIDTVSGTITGVEALARLRAQDGSLIQPDKFISVAESSGLVTVMGEQVLDQAIDQLAQWSACGFDIQLNVNVSPRQLSRASFAPNVFERLLTRGLPPHSLCLEITEGAVVDATGPTLITLRRLRSYGVHVGIDDFGTGYSSLTTLKYLPADVLKVDRSFVEGLGSDASDSAIVSAVIRVAHDLGCVVVAEGVESEQQVSLLRSMNCDQVQGYRFGRPVSADEMTIQLAGGTAAPVAIDLTDGSDQRTL